MIAATDASGIAATGSVTRIDKTGARPFEERAR